MRLFKFLLLLCLLMNSKLAYSSDKYPVEWKIIDYFDKMPNNSSDFNGYYNKKWKANRHIVVFYHDKKKVLKKKITSCSDLDIVKNKIVKVQKSDFGDPSFINDWRVDCTAMKKIAKMQSSAEKTLDSNLQQVIKNLPDVSNKTQSDNIISLFANLKNANIECFADNSCKVRTDDLDSIFFLQAKGDYNKDGIEDYLITGSVGIYKGGGDRSFGFIVTKTCHSCSTSILDWWEGDRDLNR